VALPSTCLACHTNPHQVVSNATKGGKILRLEEAASAATITSLT